MPFKHNAARRHRIGRMKFKATNWPEYEAGLRRHGSLTLWLIPEALAMGVVAWITRRLILSVGFRPQVFSLLIGISTMPHTFNAARRDKIAKQKYQVTNWPAYNESLRQRGDLTIWVKDEALSLWTARRRTSRGGQSCQW
ncbi:hypothetical protein ACVI3U_003909 [Sinorhizobium medicae]